MRPSRSAAFLLLIALLLPLSSCGKGEDNAPSSPSLPAESEQTGAEDGAPAVGEEPASAAEPVVQETPPAAQDEENPVPETEAAETRQETEVPAEQPAGSAGEVELYQLAPEGQSLLMSYVIITPSKKVVVIDGGTDGAGQSAPPYLPSAIRAILGLGQNDRFEVEAWFLSHIHNDHYYELAKMMKRYRESDNYRINNIYFDFPDYGTEWTSSAGDGDFEKANFDILVKGFDHYCETAGFTGIEGAAIPEDRLTAPEGSPGYYYGLINGAVINEEAVEEGLTITVDGVDFQILMTWWEGSSTINNTSVIIRMVYGGNSVLFLGDCGEQEGRRLLELRSPDEVKSDYVQMGHHGQGGPNKAFYDAIGAKDAVRLWPTPEWVWNNAQSYAIGQTRSWLDLPYKAKDFQREKLFNTGRDFVAGCCRSYPRRSARVDDWTERVLAGQRVAVFGGP